MLIMLHVCRRSEIPTLPYNLQVKIRNITGKQQGPNHDRPPQTKVRCEFCPLRKNRFTQRHCSNCQNSICKEHTAATTLICRQCFGNDEDA